MQKMETQHISITVYGTPAPQGSKKYAGHRKGKPLLLEMSKKLKPWREVVHWAAKMTRQHISGPIEVSATFTLRRPKGVSKEARPFPDVYPDLDKLLRSTMDGLKTAGAIDDDAKVVRFHNVEKVYPDGGGDAMSEPGAIIHITKKEKR